MNQSTSAAGAQRPKLHGPTLVFTTERLESETVRALLMDAGLETFPCSSIQELCAAAEVGAGVIIVSSEVLSPGTAGEIRAMLRKQPDWSDLPLIVLIDLRREFDSSIEYLRKLGNVTLLERPVVSGSLAIAVETALLSRQRQYELRDLQQAYRAELAASFRSVESAEDYAIMNLDHDGVITYWSPGAMRLFGFNEDEIVGKPVSTLFTTEDRALGVPALELETARNYGRAEEDRWHIRKDGSLFWSSGVITQMRQNNGAPSGFIRISRDITSRRLSEERLLKQAEALRISNDELSQFAYAASHDLQEPLRMIITYSEYLARELRNSLSERAEQALKYIMEGGQRMQGLIEGLLAYSRALHEVEDPLAVVDPGQVLDKVLLNLRAMILDKSAFVTSSELPSVMVHEIHLVQLFQNLIGNSLKYSRSDVVPEIAVRGARVEELVRFTVEDNGIGIPRQYASDIFGIFKRLHSKDYSGSGIGLAICQRIVARYGGSIWVDSEPGRGATFHFTLPAGEEL